MKSVKFMILAVMALLVAASCQEMEQPEGPSAGIAPVFPEKVTDHNVAPGAELEFVFTPNLDWELSISEGSYQFFRLLEANGRQRESISGKASEEQLTVKIWVNPLEEYDNNRSCRLILKMGGEERIVAEYMRPAKNRTFAIYRAQVQDGAYLTDETGAYVYEETAAEGIDLVWSAADAEFVVPVRVESNCQWEIDRDSFPEWLELKVPEVTSGVVYLAFRGVSLEDSSADIVFSSGGEELQRMSVSIPSCSGLNVYSAIYEDGDWKYVDAGYEYVETPSDSYTMVWTGYDCRLPVMVDSKCEWTLEKPDWITVELDDKRAGQDIFNIMCDPSRYPLDDAEFELTFKFRTQVLKTVSIIIPGCREMVSYSLGMSLTDLEFNYAGLYKTSAGYMDAPVIASVTGPVTSVLRTVEIVDGICAGTSPEWLNCDLYVSDDTDTDKVLQTRSLDISVSENMTDASRSAYIFILPSDVQDVADLFNEDGQTVREEYLQYSIPVSQACVPADYLTPENSAADMEAEGAFMIKTTKQELYNDPCFGPTRYAYEMTYKNTWSGDVAKMYLTEPYKSIQIYDADKNLVEDTEDFWFTYTDYQDDFGAITIFTSRKQLDADGNPVLDEKGNEIWMELIPEAGTGYLVFKGDNDLTLCVVEFTYAPEIIEPEEPEVVETDLLEDASQYFYNKEESEAAGFVFSEIKAISIPTAPSSFESEEEKKAFQDKFDLQTSLYKALGEYRAQNIPFLRLEFPQLKLSTKLNLAELIKGVATMYSVNPYAAREAIKLDGKTQEQTQGIMSSTHDGCPVIRLESVDYQVLKSTPLVILYYEGTTVVLAIHCVLKTDVQ